MIGLRAHAEMRLEKPVYLPRRQPGRVCQLPHVDTTLELGIEQFGQAPQLRVAKRVFMRGRQALRGIGSTHSIVNELFRDRGRDGHAMLPSDEVQHHIHGRRGSRRGEPIPIDLVNVVGENHLRENLLDARSIFPVDGRLIAVEQSGARQNPACGFHAPQHRALTGKLAQPGNHSL